MSHRNKIPLNEVGRSNPLYTLGDGLNNKIDMIRD